MRGLGLTAGELRLVLDELEEALAGLAVADVALLVGGDDLLLWFRDEHRRAALHVVPGGERARLTLTRRRFPRERFLAGPRAELLRARLVGCRLQGVTQPAGERRCSLALLAGGGGRLSLEVELFGNRGLWCVLDGSGRIVELSRPVAGKERKLEPGAAYAPPGAGRRTAAEPLPRFAPPVLQAVDDLFAPLDEQAECEALRSAARRDLQRRRERLRAQIDGLRRQREEAQVAPALRREADLLLSYAHLWRRGQSTLVVPDPERDGGQLTLAVDPLLPLPAQAERRYDRARRLEDGAPLAAQRQAKAEAELEQIEGSLAELEQAGDERLRELAIVAAPAPRQPPRRPAGGRKTDARAAGLRRFTSAEGYPILAGKSNEQNDRLSLRVASGNDLWFHVGQGYAGSHVVVRLPKGKTASLETLLDAGTIAIHFSKARGATVCDVTYTLAKHVRKPGGAPPGRVTVAHEKTLRVRHEPSRLQRLLASAAPKPH